MPKPGIDRAPGRVVALIALLILVGIALRGYLPGEEPAQTDQAGNHTPAMIAVVVLLGAAVAIITIAIVATLRQPRTQRPAGDPLGRSPAGQRGRPSWRVLLIAVGLILAWLVLVLVLMQFSVVIDLGRSSSTTTSTTSAPVTSPTQPVDTPAAPQEDGGGGVFWYLLATTIFMVVVWVAGFLISMRQRRRAPQPQPVQDETAEFADQPAPRSLAMAAERGLAEMGDLSRDPREAIIACYAAMEDALSTAPDAMPQDSDTPSEVLARAVEHHAINAGTATDLVELFAEARFSPHVMTEEHREVAMRALGRVLAELKSAA